MFGTQVYGKHLNSIHRMVDPYFEKDDLPPPSRGTYHGVIGNRLKVTYPGYTDLVWSTNFNDAWAPYLVCNKQRKWSTRLKEDMYTLGNGRIHPEFVFTKKISYVNIKINESTKFSWLDKLGERYMTTHRPLWNATFKLNGGNHVLPNMAPNAIAWDFSGIPPIPPWGLPKMVRLCDAPVHRVWSGTNIGKWNEQTRGPTLNTWFDVKIRGMTMGHAFFEDTMRIMLDRRYAFQDLSMFKKDKDALDKHLKQSLGGMSASSAFRSMAAGFRTDVRNKASTMKGSIGAAAGVGGAPRGQASSPGGAKSASL